MNSDDLTYRWASRFGLALAPLFETDGPTTPGNHAVLLDGGYGSFALSVSNEELWRRAGPADWVWSSDLPHHVTVTDSTVAVTRWDRQGSELLSRSSVENRLDSFYSFLAADRVRSNQSVVSHAVNFFRRVRTLVANSGLPDERSVEVFLAFFQELVQRDRYAGVVTQSGGAAIGSTYSALLRSMPSAGVESLLEEMRGGLNGAQSLRLFPLLAVRHASSEIFQEAHFELLRAPNLDLFSYAGPAETKLTSRGGAHFTPAALARTVVEQTFAQVEDLASKDRITILDPACGSGAFLYEAVRSLRRLEFGGKIVVVGRDISSAALAMADFVLQQAILDWSPETEIELNLQVADSLTAPLPNADIVLMNPPFVAWPALSSPQRETVKEILGNRLRGRGDISMAFVTKAMNRLQPGGAMGVLLPSSLLTLQAAEGWRGDLLENMELRLLASLGEFGLFAHALVQIVAAVFAKATSFRTRQDSLTALIASDSSDATGNALRTLRRTGSAQSVIGADDAWSLFTMPASQLKSRATWRLTSPKAEAALAALLESGISRVADMFDVRQGIRTGDNKAFVLGMTDFDHLPTREKRYFLPAIMNDSVKDGQIQDRYRLFYPYTEEGGIFSSEAELQRAVPKFFEMYLLPKRAALISRSSLVRERRSDWWTLSWPRTSWAFDKSPRLVSKYFGSAGGVAADLAAGFMVVQGFAWFPKWEAAPDSVDDNLSALSVTDVLYAYVALMNSGRYNQVLEMFSPHVAGGQFDLSPRYVNQIPIPDMVALSAQVRTGRLITRMADLGRNPRIADFEWRASVDRITVELYGDDFFQKV